MAKPKVLLIHPTIRKEGVEFLAQHAELIYAPAGDEETLIEFVRKDIEAVVVRTENITRDVIRAGSSLRVLGQNGVGVDNIDVEAATANGVAVVNVPKANAPSVGEHVAMLILALSKNLFKADRAVRSGDWMFRDRHLPSEIMGKTVYLIGFGNNAKETAKILRNAFFMDIKAYDPFVSAREMAELGVAKVDDLYDGFADSKYVSVHVPSTPSTYHLIDERAFSKMRDVYFINCSRGVVVDTESFCRAVKRGNIVAAGLDVFEEEPPALDSEVLKLDNVIVTPHFAGDTLEAKQRCALTLAEDLIRGLSGKLPEGLYNQDLKHKFNN